jgi:inosine/xanthosine triphosphatase
MKVLVGSCNPVKLAAVHEVFAQHFSVVEVVGAEVASGAPPQPIGEETFAGAEQRARTLAGRNAREGLAASYAVGVEGGVIRLHNRWFAFAAVCIADAGGRIGFGASPFFELPAAVMAGLHAGAELGDVIDRLTGQHNTRQAGGAIGFLTQGRIVRQALLAQGVAMALAPFLNEALFFGGECTAHAEM